MHTETNLDSFILRFVQETRPGEEQRRAPGWHAVIRHVQSDKERHFTRWADALTFISEFVDLREDKTDA